MHNDNKTIKVRLENGAIKTDLELTGMKGAKNVLKQVFKSFLASIEEEETKPAVLIEEMQKIYEEVVATTRIEKPVSKEADKVDDNMIEPTDNQLDKYNKEYPKLQNAVSRNFYNKLTELQINQQAYFVTDLGVLKLQGRYSCACGNFKKAWIAYPSGKKTVRCTECAKDNTLVNVKGTFPTTDEFGNFYVTSNMIKSLVDTAN